MSNDAAPDHGAASPVNAEHEIDVSDPLSVFTSNDPVTLSAETVRALMAQAFAHGVTKASPHGGAYLRSLLAENPYRQPVESNPPPASTRRPVVASPTVEKTRIVEVLGQHVDVNSDHAMHGWACSCGWGASSGPPPWTKHTYDAFLDHVAHMLLQPTPANSPEGTAAASQSSGPDQGQDQIEAMARAIAEAADDGCFDRIDTGQSDESTGDWEDADYYRRLARAAHGALSLPDQESA